MVSAISDVILPEKMISSVRVRVRGVDHHSRK